MKQPPVSGRLLAIKKATGVSQLLLLGGNLLHSLFSNRLFGGGFGSGLLGGNFLNGLFGFGHGMFLYGCLVLV